MLTPGKYKITYSVVLTEKTNRGQSNVNVSSTGWQDSSNNIQRMEPNTGKVTKVTSVTVSANGWCQLFTVTPTATIPYGSPDQEAHITEYVRIESIVKL
jgi:hypothetical protein